MLRFECTVGHDYAILVYGPKPGSGQMASQCRGARWPLSMLKSAVMSPSTSRTKGKTKKAVPRGCSSQSLSTSGGHCLALMDNLADAVIVSCSKITWCNSRIESILGFAPEELVGQDVSEFLASLCSEPASIDEIYRGVDPQSDIFHTARLAAKNGSSIDVELSVSRVPSEGTPETMTVIRDITRRTLAEEALQQSEERLRALIENAQDVIVVVDAEGRVVYESPSVEKLVGYTVDEVLGSDGLSFIHPEDGREALDTLSNLLLEPGATATVELRARHRDGSWRVAEAIAQNLLEHPAVRGIVVNVRDITERRQVEDALRQARDELETRVKQRTIELAQANSELQIEVAERKQAEEALRQSEEYFRALLENSLDAIVVINPDGTYRYQTPSVQTITGHSPEERLGRNIFDLVHPDDRERVTRDFERMVRGELANVETETRICRDDGRHRILEVRGANLLSNSSVGAIVASFRDVTEQRQAQEVLKHSEEFFRALLDNSLDAIVLLNRDGTMRYKNPANERMLGYDQEERVGGGPFDHIHPDDVSQLIDKYSEFMSEPGGTLHAEVRVQHKDSSWRVVEAIGCNLLHNPALECVVVNMRDITERKLAEQALREREEHFRSLIENSLDGIAIADRKGVIRYESPSVERIAGYAPEELVGKRMMDYIHPDDVPRVLSLFKELSTNPGQTASFECRFKLKNGQWATFEAIMRNLLEDPIVNGFVINYRDISERKMAEEELRIKENAIENSINAVAMSDMVGNITYVNRACMSLWGNNSKEDLIGKPYWKLIEVADVPIAKEIAASIVETGAWEGELRGRRKDGRQLYVQVASALVKDEKGTPIHTISSFIDVTERKMAEEALRASEEKFRRFLEDMNDGYCVLEGFNIAYANARCAEMFGYDQHEVIGQPFKEFLPPEIVEELARIHARRQRGEWVPSQYEGRLVRKDGTECTVEFGPRLTEYQGKPAVSVVIRDITQRKLMEKALRESEAEFRTIFEEAAIGIALIDMQARPLEINMAFQEMLGYDMEDLKNMSSFDYLHPEDALSDAPMFEDMVNGAREHYNIEKRLIRKDGESLWVRQNLSLVRGAEGEPRFMIAMIEDINERKKAEEERQKMEQQLQLTGRLAAVGELAAGVAHELNNPLAAVQAYAQFLATQRKLDESIKSDIDTIYREAQRAARITSNLLSFSRRHKPEKSLLSINDIIEKSLELHAYRMRVNNIEVVLSLEPDLPMTMVDFHQMQQVFVNLITNAEQAMTESHGSGRLVVSTEFTQDMIRASFTDNGPGISEENLKRVFDPFFTTKDVGKGTGLGLSICFGIVQEHGGRMFARSIPGESTTFVVELPAIQQDKTADNQNGAARQAGA